MLDVNFLNAATVYGYVGTMQVILLSGFSPLFVRFLFYVI